MNRPKFPKAPAKVKIPAHSMRYLALWKKNALAKGLNPYSSIPSITIRPVGYWGDTITVRDSNFGGEVMFKISYSSGGTDGTISNEETIDNFIAGLQYAKELAKWMEAMLVWVRENSPEYTC